MSPTDRVKIPLSWRLAIKQKGVRRNAAANFLGRMVPAGLTFFTIPILVSALGSEAYGLVAIALSMEALFMLLDFGLSASINREVARNIAAQRPPDANRNLLRTLEVVYWPIGLLIMGLVLSGVGWFTRHAVRPNELPYGTVRFAFTVIALILAVRWPVSLYLGVLRGLQAQVLVNGIRIVGSVVRIVGGVTVVLVIAPTLEVFFVAQLLGSILEIALIMTAVWRVLPASPSPPRFDLRIVRSIWRFSLGYSLLSILIQVMYQVGILAVAKLLPLRETGFYSVALSLAGVIMFLPYAVHEAVFPRFADQSQRNDSSSFDKTFQQALLASTMSSVAVAMPIVFFSVDLLYFWTRSWSLARGAGAATALLSAGYLFHQFWAVGYVAVTAAGRIRFPLIVTFALTVVAVAMTGVGVAAWGIVGAALVWLVANIFLAAIYPVYMRRSLGFPKSCLLYRDVSMLASWGVVAFGIAALLSRGSSPGVRTLSAAAACIVFLACSVLAIPGFMPRSIRSWLR